MLNLLKNLYNKTEQIKGRRLYTLIFVIFLIFISLGFASGYFINKALRKNEATNVGVSSQEEVPVEKEYIGKVKYVDPKMYPGGDVSYVLVDSSGKKLILLQSQDQKLTVAENLNVRVYGTVDKIPGGDEDVLNVTKVIIQNASN